MCIGFWSLIHPHYSLVLCTNRDEFLSRPADVAHWHSFGEHQNEREREQFVLSGIDTQAGGTWFGINKHGDVTLLTNISEPKAKYTSSRGHLGSSFLLRNNSSSQNSTLLHFVNEMTASKTLYAGFNMLLLAPDQSTIGDTEKSSVEYHAVILSNDGGGKPIRCVPIPETLDGCGCISNSAMSGIDPFTGMLTDQEWPKVSQGRRLFSETLSQSVNEAEDVLIERLFDMLRTKARSPPGTPVEFRETIMVDAVDLTSPPPWPSRSSMDIPQKKETSDVRDDVPATAQSHYYATRLSTVLLVKKDGTATFVERDVWINDKDGHPVLIEQGQQHPAHHERRHSFPIR